MKGITKMNVKKRTFHCFFEQSGTFKKEFKKLGYKAIDYDILNDFGETDKVIDLFKEIEIAFNGGGSIFDKIKSTDMIIAFFPCIKFEVQQIMHFQGTAVQMKNYTREEKLAYNLLYHREMHDLYELITKMVVICIRKNIPLVIENPYSTQHFLTRYWCIKPSLIDYDRTQNGDYFVKPTQYWFINCEPKNNLIFDEPIALHPKKDISNTHCRVTRSMISPDYARRFIRQYLVESENDYEKD